MLRTVTKKNLVGDMPGRTFSSELYRYGYQGSERDPEMLGGAGYTTFFRALDPRIGRWLTPDPKVFPWQSPYVSMDGNPVALVDPWGASTDGPDEGGDDFTFGSGDSSGEDNSMRFSSSDAGNTGGKEPTTLSPLVINPMLFEMDQIVFQKSGFATEEEFNNMLNVGATKLAEKDLSDENFTYKLTGDYNKGTQEFSLAITRTTERSSLGMSNGGDNLNLIFNTGGSLVSITSDLMSPAAAYVEKVDRVTPAQRMKRVKRSQNPYRIYDNKITGGRATFRISRIAKFLKWLGPLASGYGTIMSVEKIMSGDFDGWDVADASLGAVSTIVGLTAVFVGSGPILAGISTVTGVYFLARMINEMVAPTFIPSRTDEKLGEPYVCPNDNTTVGNNPMGGY